MHSNRPACEPGKHWTARKASARMEQGGLPPDHHSQGEKGERDRKIQKVKQVLDSEDIFKTAKCSPQDPEA